MSSLCGDLHWPITRKRGRGEGISMSVRYGLEAIQDFGGTRGPHRILWNHVDQVRPNCKVGHSWDSCNVCTLWFLMWFFEFIEYCGWSYI